MIKLSIKDTTLKKKTIFTTNYSFKIKGAKKRGADEYVMEKSLQQRISTTSFSRIEEMCQFIANIRKSSDRKKKLLLLEDRKKFKKNATFSPIIKEEIFLFP